MLIYFLTPKGIEEKAEVTYRLLQRKLEEYENIKIEIESLKDETALSKVIKPKVTGVKDSEL